MTRGGSSRGAAELQHPQENPNKNLGILIIFFNIIIQCLCAIEVFLKIIIIMMRVDPSPLF